MSSAAQRDEASDSYQQAGYQQDGTDGRGALKQLAAERLAAHRNRRAVVENMEAQARREQAEAQAAVRLQARRDANRAEAHPDALRVREAVAARYQQSVSYREFLAAEARRATARAHAEAEAAQAEAQAAQAEAEVAARSAKAVAAAQRELLEEIEQWNRPAMEPRANPAEPAGELPLLEIVGLEIAGLEIAEPREETAAASVAENPRARRRTHMERGFGFAAPDSAVTAPFTSAQLQVRLHEAVELAPPAETFYAPSRKVAVAAEELAELDDEIEFRMAPEFGDLVLETQSIPANIIEFPRELVAPRKARPRLAEGPLRADGMPEPQLRIFEVETAQISAEPEATALADAPEWQGMMLGAGPAAESRTRISAQLEAQLHLDQPLYVATVGRRAYAAGIDLLCVSAAFAGYMAVALKIGGESVLAMPLPLLCGVVAGSFAVFALMYQLLFFTLNDATPGMRAARVGFCTFSERNPSRKAMRRRLVSTVLALCPLGLGLVWMLLDGDGLGWHDRMSRMYPRSY